MLRTKRPVWIARSHATGLAALLLATVFLALPASPVAAQPAFDGPTFELRSFPAETTPSLPLAGTPAVQLVIDDGGAEGVFGLTGSGTRQFLWLNRFESPGPFRLDEIWVLFPSGTDAQTGDAIQLVVYADPDGDPTNGAQLVGTWDEVIQAADGSTFSVYTVSPGLSLGAGSVLIGVVNRYYETGVDPLSTLPASLDTTASQASSFFALWAGDPPEPPDLATASLIDLLDGVTAGNFLIRGFGTEEALLDVPTLGWEGLALLAFALAMAGMLLVRR
jgi:hypothetical protein